MSETCDEVIKSTFSCYGRLRGSLPPRLSKPTPTATNSTKEGLVCLFFAEAEAYEARDELGVVSHYNSSK
jgi:hypothetical protein